MLPARFLHADHWSIVLPIISDAKDLPENTFCIYMYHSIHHRRRSTMKKAVLGIQRETTLHFFSFTSYFIYFYFTKISNTRHDILVLTQLRWDRFRPQPSQLMNFARLRLAMLDFMFVNYGNSKIEGFLSNRIGVFSYRMILSGTKRKTSNSSLDSSILSRLDGSLWRVLPL